ncbi:MAG: SDR family oxidoreductase [Candidatus Paceibacterota bacterium]
MRKALIIGGSSGLGLKLAEMLAPDYNVSVTGRRDPKNTLTWFHKLELDSDSLGKDLDALLLDLSEIDLLVYAAGFYQEGTIDDLSDRDLEKMNRIGLMAPAMILQRILNQQTKLPGFIAITSTSQWTPRLLEPMYTAVKAGLGMLASSIAKDSRVDKVLVAGPAGMDTRFWEKRPRDPNTIMLDPGWVSEKILDEWEGNFRYKFIRVLRGPERIEIIETR